MMKAIVGYVLAGAIAVSVPLTAWAYHDVAVNQKDMFGYAPVYFAAGFGAVIGAVIGGLAGSWWRARGVQEPNGDHE